MGMTYGYFSEAAEIARRIREADEWPIDDCRRLCQMAGLEAEWDAADGEDFMAVLDRAAEVLGAEEERMMKRVYIPLGLALQQARENDSTLSETDGICACYDVESMGFCRDGVTRWYHFTAVDGTPAYTLKH